MEINGNKLILKKISVYDLEMIHEIFSNPILLQYFLQHPDYTVKNSQIRLETILKHWEDYDFGDFLVFSKETDELIGYAGLKYYENLGKVGISFVVFREFWRNGYGSEIISILLKFCFNTLNLDSIICLLHLEDSISSSLLEKFNFKTSNFGRKKIDQRILYLEKSQCEII